MASEPLESTSKAPAAEVTANSEKYSRLRLMLADLSDVMQCCEQQGEQGNKGTRISAKQCLKYQIMAHFSCAHLTPA